MKFVELLFKVRWTTIEFTAPLRRSLCFNFFFDFLRNSQKFNEVSWTFCGFYWPIQRPLYFTPAYPPSGNVIIEWPLSAILLPTIHSERGKQVVGPSRKAWRMTLFWSSVPWCFHHQVPLSGSRVKKWLKFFTLLSTFHPTTTARLLTPVCLCSHNLPHPERDRVTEWDNRFSGEKFQSKMRSTSDGTWNGSFILFSDDGAICLGLQHLMKTVMFL